MAAIDPSVYPSAIPAAPKLIPVFEFTVRAAAPQDVLQQQSLSKSSVILPVVGGTIRPIHNSLGLKFEAKNITGNDYISTDTSVAAGKLDCRLYGVSAAGTGFTMRYDGIMKMSEKILDVLQRGSKDHAAFEEVYIGASFIFELSEGASADEKWVTSELIVGRGRLIVGKEDGSAYAQYIAHVLR